MALSEQVVLDIQSAQRQIDALERQLDQLGTPINVPVNITGANEVEGVRRDFDQTDDAVERLNRELDDTERSLRQVGTAADRGTQGVLRLGTRGASVFTNLKGSITGVVAAFGLIQGARATLDFFRDSIDAASGLEESTSKVGVVFGEFADDIQEFASTAPQALGLANRQALEFAGTFGNLFVALGLTQSAAADLAPDIVQLGADLASFNNIETTEALDKLRAGLVGEAEPLRALGVNLTAATTEAKGLELGLGGLTGELTEAEKVQARYALIVEQTATAQGDFARTSDSIANRQRTLAASFDDTRVAVGEALLPAFEQLLEIAPALIGLIEDGLVPAIASLSASIGSVDTEGLTRIIAGLPSAVGTAFSQLGAVPQAFGNALQVFGAFARLEFGDVGDQFRQLGDDIQRLREAPVANTAIQNLITTIQGGREPVSALESVLAELGKNVSGLTLETFEDLTEQLLILTTTAGADPGDLAQLADVIEVLGEQAGFSAPGVEILAAALRGPWAQAMAEASVGDIIAGNLAGTLGELGDAAAGAAPDLEGFADIDVSGQIAALNAQFAQLPDGLDAAAAALRDDENEIITDFTQFLDDLQAEIATRQAFIEDIELLEALGLDRLAEVAREAGLDFAPALEDGLQNIGELRDAEAALDEEAGRLATSMVDEFARDIASEPITAALIQEIKDAAAAADNEDVRAALEALAAALEVEIPVVFGIPDTVGIRAAIERGFPVDINAPVGSGQAPSPGGVTVNQTFEGFTPSTPDLTRAAQAVNQVTQR